ncbi:MAG: HAD hydrolase family protein [Nitrososphaeria archaeon]
MARLILASDFDRTLTDESLTPCHHVLGYISSLRPEIFFIVASGRGLEFLKENVGIYADAIVAENGAVIMANGKVIVLGEDWSREVRKVVKDGEGIWYGRVLLYALLSRREEVEAALRSSGIAYRLERNRESFMVMPPYVSKGRGVEIAIKEAGLEGTKVASVGDDMNDLSMYDVSDIRLAIGNSIQELKQQADLISSLPFCEGTMELLDRLLRIIKI